MNIYKLINIRDRAERPAAQPAGYDYEASLRRLGLGGMCDDYFVDVHKPQARRFFADIGLSIIKP